MNALGGKVKTGIKILSLFLATAMYAAPCGTHGSAKPGTHGKFYLALLFSITYWKRVAYLFFLQWRPCSQTFPAKIEFLLKPLKCRTATADRDGSLAHASGVQD